MQDLKNVFFTNALCFKLGHKLLLYFRLFPGKGQINCRCWDSNSGSLVGEPIALSTVPQPLPIQ